VKHKAERRAYTDAKYRCTSKNCADYEDYGGRGIKFLFTSFEEFFAELGPRPRNKMLDRINNQGHYEVGNVCWSTHLQSNKNRRRPRYSLTRFSTKELLAELAKRCKRTIRIGDRNVR
jgi:hypothetical protein